MKYRGSDTELRLLYGGEIMNEALLLIGMVIVICIMMNRFLEKIPVPSLLIFIALGMLFGENGLFRITFDDYAAVNLICSASLICIMFYGGFGTNLQAARPVIAKSAVLSTFGVVGTAALVGVFSHFALKLGWQESMLIGAVISSTDAASVFNILRNKKLALKNHTDSLLEVESGSNDPVSYMLTSAMIAIMSGSRVSIPLLVTGQIAFGILGGILIGKLAVWLLSGNLFTSQHARTVFLFGIMILSYALPAAVNGNGYLSAYLCGILLGNSRLSQKKYLVHFFDVLTNVAQVIIFFLLGLLVTPARLPAVLLPALAVMTFLTVAARPLVSAFLLLPFRTTLREIGVVSWAGLRGAASIVFAISAVLSGVSTKYNIFNLVFCIVIFSISLQGSLLPLISRRLSMIDRNSDVNKTFTDYDDEIDVDLIKIHLNDGHPWCGCTLSRLSLPHDLLVVMIDRDGTTVIPNGNTELVVGDLLVIAARRFEEGENIRFYETAVGKNHKLAGVALSEVKNAPDKLIVLIKRGSETIIPDGGTVILKGDILVMIQSSQEKIRM